MDIRGGYAKPNWRDILWVQLFLLPLTAVRLVFFIASLVHTDPDVTWSLNQDLDAESGTTNVKKRPSKNENFFEESVVLRGFSLSLNVLGG
jgi:hypothetical protein